MTSILTHSKAKIVAIIKPTAISHQVFWRVPNTLSAKAPKLRNILNFFIPFSRSLIGRPPTSSSLLKRSLFGKHLPKSDMLSENIQKIQINYSSKITR